MSTLQAAETIYEVVINDEAQYSIWAQGRSLPLGWTQPGKSGTRQECLDHINIVWKDMRPLSLRRKMDAAAQEQA
jgi:MbtH protein